MDRFDLCKDTFIALRDVVGMVIRCRSGIVWVTQAGDGADHLLQREEALVVTRRGVVIVEARRDAAVEVVGSRSASADGIYR